jgi:hypothetical protein
MERAIKERDRYRLDCVFFAMGLFADCLFFAAGFFWLFSAFYFAFIILLALTIGVATIGIVFLSPDVRAFFSNALSMKGDTLSKVSALIEKNALWISIVAAVAIVLSMVFLILGEKRKGRTVRLVFSVLLLIVSFISLAILLGNGGK